MFSSALFSIAFAFALSSQSAPATHGTVHFQTSCSPVVASDFNHAVAILHSFEYDEARDAFVAISKKDPKCAMAKWGEAMTYFHGLWGEYNQAGGAQAAKEARELAAQNPATTQREKAYISAISEIFSDSAAKLSASEANKPNTQGYSEPAKEPQVAYKNHMAELHRAYPNDDEGTIFDALSLNVVASRVDKTHPELHECTTLLNPLFQKLPNHPGIAHYLVHCNDNPEMAKEGLAAARKYAQIAPASAHATHMPSHIFAQLGLWDEMVQSNRASLQASEDDKLASGCQRAGNTLHAMYFLTFSLVQKGQLTEARNILERAKDVAHQIPGADKCDESDALVVAGYVMEAGDWNRAKDIKVDTTPYGFIPAVLWMAKGLGSARAGDLGAAKQAEAELSKLRDTQPKHSHHGSADSSSEAGRLAVSAWIAYQSGDKQQGLQSMQQAAEMQDRLGGSNAVFKPLREMLADMLLLEAKNKEALEAYTAVLAKQPNRFNALYGAGSAAFALGNDAIGREYYNQLVKMAQGDERPELAKARSRLTEQSAQK